jgi:hypothetical protein
VDVDSGEEGVGWGGGGGGVPAPPPPGPPRPPPPPPPPPGGPARPSPGPHLAALRAPQLPFSPRDAGAGAGARVNTEGCPMRPGSGSGAGTHYCGRHLGRDAIPGSDGRCGPNNGPQCASCRAAAAAFAAGVTVAAGGRAAGGWLAAAAAVPRRFVPPRAHPVESAADLEVGFSGGPSSPVLRLVRFRFRRLVLFHARTAARL